MSIKIVKGVDYGLTLYYSYKLPLYRIEPLGNGFIFEKIFGVCKGLRCKFSRESMETVCEVPQGCEGFADALLGLDKRAGFESICRLIGREKCVSSTITLVYSPWDAKLVLYTILLSRNTDYFINTVRWFKELMLRGFIESSSYIPRQVAELIPVVEDVFRRHSNALSIAVELLRIRGIGVKTVTALLLHAYGDTRFAPIDRHYRRFLQKFFNDLREPVKEVCIGLGLDCSKCLYRDRCVYGVARRFGELNGYIQSLAYLSQRLRIARTELEHVLVPRGEELSEALTEVTEEVIEKLVNLYGSGAEGSGLRPFPTR